MKVTNKGSQMVSAEQSQSGGVSSKVTTGGDLRVGKGG